MIGAAAWTRIVAELHQSNGRLFWTTEVTAAFSQNGRRRSLGDLLRPAAQVNRRYYCHDHCQENNAERFHCLRHAPHSSAAFAPGCEKILKKLLQWGGLDKKIQPSRRDSIPRSSWLLQPGTQSVAWVA